MTPERIQRLRAVLDRRQPDLTVVTDFVHKPRNLSAILRNCDAVGIGKIHAVLGDQHYQAFRGTAMGSHKWVEVQRYTRLQHALQPLQAAGCQLVVAHPTEGSKDFREVDYTVPTALLMGAERQGVSEQALDAATVSVSVPMVGMVQSLNVSVASGILLAEVQRQRQLAGLYDKRRIEAALYERLFFEWGHAAVRDFCQERQLRYPALNESGEIDKPEQWYASVRAGTAASWTGGSSE